MPKSPERNYQGWNVMDLREKYIKKTGKEYNSFLENIIKELVDTLGELADLQNGAPLLRHKAEWDRVMEKADKLFRELE